MNSFQDLDLPAELNRALAELKFMQPTPIQKAVIPLSLQKRDLMACAETGSGKTAAYSIPLVIQLLENPTQHALILAPTRELVHQIAEFLFLLTKYTKLQVAALVGGADIRKQLNRLRLNPRIIVATPGRLTDHLKRKSYNAKHVAVLVLDEGDRMIDMGFAPQLDVILKFLPKQRQTSLFTATLPEKVRKLAATYLMAPEKISVGRESMPVANIKQSVMQVSFKEKDNRIIDELNKRQGSIIIFAKTKHRTDLLARHLHEYGFKVDLIHGGRSQGQRNRAIENFKQGKSRILCATDVAARGIDIPRVEHVINFDLPMVDEDYVHRIGRTARNGASGEALSFVMPDEVRTWAVIAKKFKIPGAPLSGGTDRSKSNQRPKRNFSRGPRHGQNRDRSQRAH